MLFVLKKVIEVSAQILIIILKCALHHHRVAGHEMYFLQKRWGGNQLTWTRRPVSAVSRWPILDYNAVKNESESVYLLTECTACMLCGKAYCDSNYRKVPPFPLNAWTITPTCSELLYMKYMHVYVHLYTHACIRTFYTPACTYSYTNDHHMIVM